MSTPQRLLTQAQDAERLATVVSYERDRERLLRQAADWRAEAAALEAAPAASDPSGGDADPSWLARCSQALSGLRRTRGG